MTSVTSGRAAAPATPAPRDPAAAPSAVASGLAKVTVHAPLRRLDVALPEHAPLAELLPELLRQAGVGLADEGQAHGGWVLRRLDGVALSGGTGLAGQGVRDGDVLYLGPARGEWPELEYDDVVDAIAAGARRYGRSWDPAATRATGLTVAGSALLLGALVLVRAPVGPAVAGGLGLAVAAILVLAGAAVSRAYADAVSGAALAAFALPYGLAGGAALVEPGLSGPGAPRLLVGAVAVLLVAAAAIVAVGHGLRIFVGAATAGALGAVAALTGYRLPAAGAAAILLSGLLVGAGAVPVLAIRLGNLPVPVLAGDESQRPDRARVHAAVVRTDEILTGLLAGLSAVAACCAVVLARSGGTGGILLALVSSTSLLLRGRLFATVRQRLPLLVAGCVGFGALLLHWPDRWAAVFALLASASVAGFAGIRYRGRPPGPYLGRAADLLDAACVVSALPVAVAVLGLYGRVRGMID